MQTITDQIKDMASNALDRLRQGDEVEWDISLVVMPQSPPVHFITILLPSPILGEHLQAGGFIEQAHKISQTDMDDFVQAALENLRAERSAKLTEKPSLKLV